MDGPQGGARMVETHASRDTCSVPEAAVVTPTPPPTWIVLLRRDRPWRLLLLLLFQTLPYAACICPTCRPSSSACSVMGYGPPSQPQSHETWDTLRPLCWRAQPLTHPAPSPAETAALRSVHTPNLPALFAQLGISLVVSTYQARKVILVRNEMGVRGSDSIYYSFGPRLISLLPHCQKSKHRFGKPTGPGW